MSNEVVFNEVETIKITVYENSNCSCPIFKIETDNKCSNVSEIISDTLQMY